MQPLSEEALQAALGCASLRDWLLSEAESAVQYHEQQVKHWNGILQQLKSKQGRSDSNGSTKGTPLKVASATSSAAGSNTSSPFTSPKASSGRIGGGVGGNAAFLSQLNSRLGVASPTSRGSTDDADSSSSSSSSSRPPPAMVHAKRPGVGARRKHPTLTRPVNTTTDKAAESAPLPITIVGGSDKQSGKTETTESSASDSASKPSSSSSPATSDDTSSSPTRQRGSAVAATAPAAAPPPSGLSSISETENENEKDAEKVSVAPPPLPSTAGKSDNDTSSDDLEKEEVIETKLVPLVETKPRAASAAVASRGPAILPAGGANELMAKLAKKREMADGGGSNTSTSSSSSSVSSSTRSPAKSVGSPPSSFSVPLKSRNTVAPPPAAAKETATPPCKECSCVEFVANAFKKGSCNNCFHIH